MALLLLFHFYRGDKKVFYTLILWAGPPALVALFCYYRVFLKLPAVGERKPSSKSRALFRRGLGFAVFNLLTAAVVNVDYLVMSQTLGAADITQYNILSKLFNFMLVLYWAMLMAVWPELTRKLHLP